MPQFLGQHFLINQAAIERIIAAARITSGDIVIEIGPGSGALTLPLLETHGAQISYIGIEKDAALARALELEIKNKGLSTETKIIIGDALIELPKITAALGRKKFRIIGNIPYYITGALLRVIGELEHKPAQTVLMIQREVAQRVCAKPGEMNLLAAATQVWADAELLFILPPKDFDPPPKVHSAVISLRTHAHQLEPKKLAEYYRALHTIFKQPRKTLLNNLAEQADREQARSIITKAGLEEGVRPQNLNVEQIQELAAAIQEL
jgi:16S rRNA (adenine1518-N6/adenine1519-N6)-dimethyltransferase